MRPIKFIAAGRKLATTFAAAACAYSVAAHAADITTTWQGVGGGGDWFASDLWSHGVPGLSDVALIGVGTATITLNGDASVLGLMHEAGTISGTGNLLAGAATWSGGTISGAATTTYAALDLFGPDSKTVSGGRTLHATGTTLWSGNTGSGNGSLSVGLGSVFLNTGSFVELQPYDNQIDSSGNVFNDGTFRKESGTLTTVGPTGFTAFHNRGLVDVKAGTLRLQGGGNHSGSFSLGAGAMLELSGGTHNLDMTTTAGAGTLHIGAGTVNLDGGSHSSVVRIAGGILAGTAHEFAGTVTWSGGTISGTATTTFTGDLLLNGSGSKTLANGRTVVAAKDITWAGNTEAGNGTLFLGSSGGNTQLHITGHFRESQSFDHQIGGASSTRVIVSAKFSKTSDTVTTVSPAFDNSGMVEVLAGALRLQGGGSHSGSFQLAAGAELDLAGGTHHFDTTSTVGAGTLHISAGTVNLNGGSHTSPLLLSGGSLTGSNHLLGGPATWSGGTISGGAKTTFNGSLALTGGSTKTLSAGRLLVAVGDSRWSDNTAAGNGMLFFGSTGGQATLRVTGSFTEDQSFDHQIGGNGTFHNAGLYTKNSDTLTTATSGITFVNDGHVQVEAGTLRIDRAFSNDGVIEVHTGAVFQSACFSGGGLCFTNAGVLKGSGTIQPPGSGLRNIGSIEPGHSIGHLTVEGDLSFGDDAELTIELAMLTHYDRLTVTGTFSPAGTLALWNTGYVPTLGDRFEILAAGSFAPAAAFTTLSLHGFGSGVAFDLLSDSNGIALLVTAVPEPEQWALWLVGLGLMAFLAPRWTTTLHGEKTT